jgi:acyl-CoA synthetase (AMP-forming)/AMP-acid ligase II
MGPSTTGRPNYVLHGLELFAEYGEREALVGWGRRYTYTDVRNMVLDLAAGLRDHGLRPGMTVGVLITHPPEAPMLQLALHLAGCRSAWIAPGGAQHELDDYLALVSPDVLLYDTRKGAADLGRQLGQSLGIPVLCLGPDGLGPDLLATRPAGAPPFDLSTATGAPETIFQTSGTTGVPKPIHHGAGLYDQTYALARAWESDGQPLLRHMTVTPLWFVAGQTSSLINLFSGGVLFIMSLFEPADFLATIERERANSTFISPLMLYQLLDDPAVQTADTSSLFVLSVGGAAATEARLCAGIERFGPVIRITYGLSESPFISAFPNINEDPAHPDRLRSCGPPYGDVRVQIRDEHGTVLEPGEVGELWVASKLNFLGYYGRPELTGETVNGEWVRTNDFAYTDREGYLHLVGRRGDLIITGRGNHHVFPRPIEDALATHPQVRAAAVIGVPDAELGEAPHAYVVRTDHATVTAEELAALVASTLTKWWAPRTIEFVDDLPRTASGKANVKQLRAQWAAEHDSATIGVPG